MTVCQTSRAHTHIDAPLPQWTTDGESANSHRTCRMVMPASRSNYECRQLNICRQKRTKLIPIWMFNSNQRFMKSKMNLDIYFQVIVVRRIASPSQIAGHGEQRRTHKLYSIHRLSNSLVTKNRIFLFRSARRTSTSLICESFFFFFVVYSDNPGHFAIQAAWKFSSSQFDKFSTFIAFVCHFTMHSRQESIANVSIKQ